MAIKKETAVRVLEVLVEQLLLSYYHHLRSNCANVPSSAVIA
jgi:hypothetical protein